MLRSINIHSCTGSIDHPRNSDDSHTSERVSKPVSGNALTWWKSHLRPLLLKLPIKAMPMEDIDKMMTDKYWPKE
ncbi:hypothetical protein Tco_0179259 [Tanacetum coccineum]